MDEVIPDFEATRPLEYICFFCLKIDTLEGPAFAYLAVDAYSMFAYQLEVEGDDSDLSILKSIYTLSELPEINTNYNSGYTLVLADHEELADRINEIIHPFGKVIFNRKYTEMITRPVIDSMTEYLNKRNK